MIVTNFAFATCLAGMEAAVKREVARDRAGLRFAYSRPGLVTFRADGTVAVDDRSPTRFAWVWGRSLGSARTPAEAADKLKLVAANRVHVFARERDSSADLAPWRAAVDVPDGNSLHGDLVADVVVAPDEPAWLGVHRADAYHLPFPGGAIPVAMPDDAPSRAFAKIEEAIAWRGLAIAPGQTALEIGCAPGGALYALARRGLEVYGVDPAEVAPQVLALPNVHHLRVKVGALRWEDLPPVIDWLLLDVNLAPQVALHDVARLMPRLKRHLRGAVLTLKLNDWAFVDALPKLRERVVAMGFRDVEMRHLPSNRREICVVALR